LTELRKISSLIKVNVKPIHEYEHVVEGAELVFSYTITITNNSDETVQLMRRHWFIHEGLEYEREVEGEGVVGEQPILSPGEQFQYQSWLPLGSDYGTMSGFYLFRIMKTEEEIEVEIPTFVLLPYFQLN
jgi:ApaG protein